MKTLWYLYERAIEAAPATTSGPSTRQTTAAGGQTTSGPSSRTTTAAGGQTTSGPSSITTTGPSSTTTTSAGGALINTQTGEEIWMLRGQYGIDVASPTGAHNHGIAPGTKLLIEGGGSVTWVPATNHTHGIEAHYHVFNIPNHTHGMDHTHNMDHTHFIAPHVHEMDHTHEIEPHTHDMDHTHTIPAHTHDIQFGIFEGPTPTAVTVKVDGNIIPGLGTSAEEVDIIPYLAKGPDGKIKRGAWHTVEITPNSLGRIVGSVLTQIFVQSRGGGNF